MTRLIFAAILVLLCAAGPAGAQNCDGDLPQQQMNHCARLDLEAADKDLNTAYRKSTRGRVGAHLTSPPYDEPNGARLSI